MSLTINCILNSTKYQYCFLSTDFVHSLNMGWASSPIMSVGDKCLSTYDKTYHLLFYIWVSSCHYYTPRSGNLH